jgi:hypothetical protein
MLERSSSSHLGKLDWNLFSTNMLKQLLGLLKFEKALICTYFIASLIFIFEASTPAYSGARRALILVTTKYEHLRNPSIDVETAQKMSLALKRQDFDVIEAFNVNNSHIRGKLGRFAHRLGPSDFALIVLVGHVVTIRKAFAYVPKDARPARIQLLGISFIDFMTQLRRARHGLLLVLSSNPDLPSQFDWIQPYPHQPNFRSDNVSLVFSNSIKVPVSRFDYYAQRAIARITRVIGNGVSDGRQLASAVLADNRGTRLGYLGAMPLSLSGSADPNGKTSPRPGPNASRRNDHLLETKLGDAYQRIEQLEKVLKERSVARFAVPNSQRKNLGDIKRLREQIAQQIKLIKGLQAENRQSRKRTSELGAELSRTTNAYNNLRRETEVANRNLDQRLKGLQTRLAESEVLRSSSLETKRELLQENERSKRDWASQIDIVRDLKVKLSKGQKEKDKLEASLARKAKDNDALRDKVDAIKEAADQRIEELQKQHDNKLSSLSSSLDAQRKLLKSNDRLKKEFVRQSKIVRDHEEKLESANKKKAALEAQLALKLIEKSKALEEDRQETDSLRARLFKFEAELQRAKVELTNETTARRKSEDLALKASRIVERSEQKMRRWFEDHRAVRQQEENMQQRLEELQRQYENTKMLLQRAIVGRTKLEEELAEMR